MHMLFRRNFQRHGFQTNIYACGVDLFNKPSGILGAGEFFLKIVKAKAIVDTLVQNAAQFTVPLYNADGAAACLPGSIRSRQPRRTAADHNKIILHFPLPPLVSSIKSQVALPSCTISMGSFPSSSARIFSTRGPQKPP